MRVWVSYCQFPMRAAFCIFVELVVFLFEFQFALAAFCDVAVLAEDHAVVRVHDAFKVIGSVTQCHFVIMD